ncbi:hypothetical protein H5J22_09510 [Cetobacterium sp. 8H]|uniref:hypothetical protein n=1 Tax=Cetobacterium sp. 8H TaxID=2759681 RepID=UPI00163C5C38|nr:hypothetical protein [Cetobacterium sp. 8H]MBC2851627.1 hypothetical protein [Cetobacterium sp. 8H]
MFLSPGEKILKYRKHYKITQEELTTDKISKTYLGMVENGKKSLSKKTGLILFKNLEKKLNESGIDFNLTYDELMESSEIQAEKYLENFLNQKDCLKNSKWMIEEAILNLNPTEQKKYLLRIANFYLEKGELNESRRIFAKFFQRVSELKRYETEFLKFLELNAKFKKYEVIMLIFKKYEDDFKNLKLSRAIEQVYYYYVLSLWKLEEGSDITEEKLLFLENLKSKDVKKQIFKILGEINLKNKKYDEAFNIYTNLLKKATSLDEKLEIAYSLVELYIQSRNFVELKSVYLKLKKIKEKHLEKNNMKKFKLLYTLGRIGEILNRKTESKEYYIEALIIGKGIDVPLNQVIEIIVSLFKMFEKSDYYSLVSIEKEYLRILENYEDYKPVIKLMEYYYNNYPQKMAEKFNIFNNYLE